MRQCVLCGFDLDSTEGVHLCDPYHRLRPPWLTCPDCKAAMESPGWHWCPATNAMQTCHAPGDTVPAGTASAGQAMAEDWLPRALDEVAK